MMFLKEYTIDDNQIFDHSNNLFTTNKPVEYSVY